MPCKKCGSQLFFGKGEIVRTLWCPNCEGLEILSKRESNNLSIEHIKELGKKIKELLNIFDSESLITTLLVTREGYLLPIISGHGFNSFRYLSLNDLISEILIEGSKGTKKCDYLDVQFQELIRLAESYHEALRVNLLIKQNLGCFIRLPWNRVKDFAVEFDTVAILKGEQNAQIPEAGFTELFKFNENWVDIYDNLIDNGFVTGTMAYKHQTYKIKIDKVIEDYLYAVHIKTMIELAMKDKEILEQNKFKENFHYIDLIDKLSSIFWDNLKIDKQTPTEFECHLIPVDKETFEEVVKTYNFDITTTYELLVTTIGKRNTFPLAYQDKNNLLLIPPITLALFRRFVEALYSKELKDKLSKEGYNFEEKVGTLLESIGLSVNQPNDCTKKLINIKDNYENPTIEIDLIAYDYNKKKLYVIDCKNILFTTDFIIGTRETLIRKKLKEEPAKQKKRIEFVKNNLSKFGFSSRKIKKYISIIITTNKEPIHILDNCHIISIRDANKIKKLEPIT